MAFATPFILYTLFPQYAKLERWLFYLDADTRPDFPDEVPPAEAKLVEQFEFLPYPWKIECKENAAIAYFGDPHEEEDLHEYITPMMRNAKLLGAKKVLVYWSYEGEFSYEDYEKGRRRRLWSSGDETDEAQFPTLLSEDQIKQLELFKEEPEKVVEFLAKVVPSA